MNFASDNWAGASANVAAALAAAAPLISPAYGNDDGTRAVEGLFGEIFGRKVRVFFVATGTAANVLSLESMMRPGGVVFCHADAHVRADEGGASEYFFRGRLHPVNGDRAKLTPEALADEVGRYLPLNVHNGRPVAVSLTQASELGTVYRPEEVAALAEVARRHGMGVHMDGARFANAVAALGVEPAEITWRAGVDILSFGATKNGCWCAEAVVLFDPARVEDFAYAHKRAGQLFSKSRFVAAQFQGYFDGGHWLDNARHANVMARRLADGIAASGAGRLYLEPEANEVFAVLAPDAVERLKAAGARFYPWPPAGPSPVDGALCRMVASFATGADEVDRFVATLSGR